MRRAILVGVLCAAVMGAARPAAAESLQSLFDEANEAYFQGHLQRAIEGYAHLVEVGVHDPDVYFNLAVAHGRRGELGRAVLYLRRTLWLRPGDDVARQELAAAQASLGKRRAERQGEATVHTRPPLAKAVVAPLSENGLAGAALGLDVLLFGLLLLRRRTRDSVRLGLAIAAALTTLALCAGAAALVIKAELLEAGRGAVVLTEDAPLREGPHESAEERRRALEGQLARVLEAEGAYVRVRLRGGGAGWMERGDLELIRPD